MSVFLFLLADYRFPVLGESHGRHRDVTACRIIFECDGSFAVAVEFYGRIPIERATIVIPVQILTPEVHHPGVFLRHAVTFERSAAIAFPRFAIGILRLSIYKDGCNAMALQFRYINKTLPAVFLGGDLDRTYLADVVREIAEVLLFGIAGTAVSA